MGFISDCVTGFMEGVREGLEESLILTKKRKENRESPKFDTITILTSVDKKVVRFRINETEPTLSKIINLVIAMNDETHVVSYVDGNIVDLTFADEIYAERFIRNWNNR